MKVTDENTLQKNDQLLIDWDDLYYDLKNQRAILILGPEFYNIDGIPIKEFIYKELTKKEDHGILHFYPGNGIFLFKSQAYKNKAQKVASQVYSMLEADKGIISKIMELPFRMILNTCPDKILEKKYKDRNMLCQFDYFTWRPNKKNIEIAAPDNYYPLIYNLFGSVDLLESIVLDFEDLFDHLRTLLNNVNVPEEIRTILNETDSFIFIGFHLEKWDTQLLFRYLNMKENSFDDSKKNYTTKSLSIDFNAESFFRQQFNLKYYGVPIEFLNDLHQKYFEMAVKEDKKQVEGLSPVKLVEKYIAMDDIQKVLNFLTNYVDKANPGMAQDLVLIKSNFSGYMYRKTRKLESTEFLDVQRNKIKQSLLDFVNGLQL